MDDLAWFRLLFTIALVCWISVCTFYTSWYAISLFRRGWRHPFIVASLWTAFTCTGETALYWYVVWFDPDHVMLVRVATYMIPIALILSAVAYVIFATWVMRLTGRFNPQSK